MKPPKRGNAETLRPFPGPSRPLATAGGGAGGKGGGNVTLGRPPHFYNHTGQTNFIEDMAKCIARHPSGNELIALAEIREALDMSEQRYRDLTSRVEAVTRKEAKIIAELVHSIMPEIKRKAADYMKGFSELSAVEGRTPPRATSAPIL